MEFKHIHQTPHCDGKVLHAPGECEYCDGHAEWQELRQMWGIAFTGHSEDTVKAFDYSSGTPTEYDKKLIPCPSEWDRPLDTINKWPRNRPATRK